jgi:CRISPR-associated endonuclease/helicase Cas3
MKMSILDKSKGISLREHTEHLKEVWKSLFEKIKQDKILNEIVNFCIEKHDLGKVLPAFQIKTLVNLNYEPYYISLNVPHSIFSTFFVKDEEMEKFKEIFGEDTKEIILSIIAFHHWRESFERIINGDSSLVKVANKLLEDENFKNKLIENLKNEGFEVNINERVVKSLAKGTRFLRLVFPPYLNKFLPLRLEVDDKIKKYWVLSAGFLQRCDHFASFCEENGENFCNVEIDNISFEEIRGKVSSNIGENAWQIDKINKNSDLLNKNIILIAPTGYGKTEFVFLYSDGEKLIYTLPLRSAVNQIFQRAENIFGDDKVGLLHSDADVVILSHEGDEEGLRTYELSRQISYPVIISTGDQFFPYALNPPTYEKIYSILSYSRLVIDEVQAYDPRACAIVVKFIEDTIRMGGKFLLTTATLPKFVKDKINKIVKQDELEEINIYEEEKDKFQRFYKHKLEVRLIDNRKKFDLPEDELKKIINRAEEGKRVLVVLNTVKFAQEVYRKLKERITNQNIKIMLIHSRFTLEDRRKKEEEIGREFSNPKPENENEGKILVATQVVEASLDLDADILFTEICPLDLLVQRMGRVARRYFYINGKVYNKSNNEEKSLEREFKAFGEYNGSDPNIFVWVFKNGLQSDSDKEHVYHKDVILLSLKILSKSKDLGKEEVELSEYDKYIIVDLLYSSLPENSKYLEDFEKTYEILNSGFVSDKKSEAFELFRIIYDIQIIPENKFNDFVAELEKFKSKYSLNEKGLYTKFKIEVPSKFLVNMPIWNLKDKINAENLAYNRILKLNLTDGWLEKFRYYLSGIYVIELNYDQEKGVYKEKKESIAHNRS